MIQEYLTYVRINLFNILSIITGIIGIILAIVFYFKSRKAKIPLYALKSFNLLNRELLKINDIKIKYKGIELKNLTASKFGFWNGGKDAIYKDDIPINSPLTIKTNKDVLIYGAEIIYTSDESNQIKFQLDLERNEIYIYFEYLDYSQGAIINILHSGYYADLLIKGKVIGAGDYLEAKEKPNEDKPMFMLLFLLYMSLVGIIAIDSLYFKIPDAIVIILTALKISELKLRDTNIPKPMRKIFDE